MLACSGSRGELIPHESSIMVPEFERDTAAVEELIPAEWTVAEDTSETGEVTTLSLQLPAARDIGGLLDGEPPRLILRCVEGRLHAFIDSEAATEPGAGSGEIDPVEVELDSAPACE
jgi:hypothetical protein